MPIGMRHIDPVTSCAECGYDMAGFDTGHTCPECGVSFDPSIDLRQSRWYLRMSVASTVLAIVLMPFAAVLSIVLLVPTLWVETKLGRKPLRDRAPVWCRGLVRRIVILRYVVCGELLVMYGVSLVWPDAFNWW